jgi:hypothetical protein
MGGSIVTKRDEFAISMLLTGRKAESKPDYRGIGGEIPFGDLLSEAEMV